MKLSKAVFGLFFAILTLTQTAFALPKKGIEGATYGFFFYRGGFFITDGKDGSGSLVKINFENGGAWKKNIQGNWEQLSSENPTLIPFEPDPHQNIYFPANGYAHLPPLKVNGMIWVALGFKDSTFIMSDDGLNYKIPIDGSKIKRFDINTNPNKNEFLITLDLIDENDQLHTKKFPLMKEYDDVFLNSLKASSEKFFTEARGIAENQGFTYIPIYPKPYEKLKELLWDIELQLRERHQAGDHKVIIDVIYDTKEVRVDLFGGLFELERNIGLNKNLHLDDNGSQIYLTLKDGDGSSERKSIILTQVNLCNVVLEKEVQPVHAMSQ